MTCQTGRGFFILCFFFSSWSNMTAVIVREPLLTEIICGEDRRRQAVRFHFSCCLCVCSIQLKSCLCCVSSKVPKRFIYMYVRVRPSCPVFCLPVNQHLITLEIFHRLLFPFSTVCLCDVRPLRTSPSPPRQLPGAELIAPCRVFDYSFFPPPKGSRCDE